MTKFVLSILLLISVTNKELSGFATYYHDKFIGRKTATGEIFYQNKMTAASNNFKLGTMVEVENVKTGNTVIVKINDRMHPNMAARGRVVDLTTAAAKKLGFYPRGTAEVIVREI